MRAIDVPASAGFAGMASSYKHAMRAIVMLRYRRFRRRSHAKRQMIRAVTVRGLAAPSAERSGTASVVRRVTRQAIFRIAPAQRILPGHRYRPRGPKPPERPFNRRLS